MKKPGEALANGLLVGKYRLLGKMPRNFELPRVFKRKQEGKGD